MDSAVQRFLEVVPLPDEVLSCGCQAMSPKGEECMQCPAMLKYLAREADALVAAHEDYDKKCRRLDRRPPINWVSPEGEVMLMDMPSLMEARPELKPCNLHRLYTGQVSHYKGWRRLADVNDTTPCAQSKEAQ